MYQVNYNGLKKRESYDELVAIVEGDRSKIKYPNRYATFLSNSPYMKVIDEETLIDLQGQSLMEQKGQLKNVILKEISTSTGTPYTFLHAQAGADKSEAAVQTAQQQLRDIAVGDDDVEDFRDAVGEAVDDEQRRAQEKKVRIANLATQHLADMKQSIEPVEARATETQTKLSTRARKIQTETTKHANKKAQVNMFREEPRRRSMPRATMKSEEEEDIKQRHAEMMRRLRKENEVKRGNAVKREAASSSAGLRDFMRGFANVAVGVGSMLYPGADVKNDDYSGGGKRGKQKNDNGSQSQGAKRERAHSLSPRWAEPVGVPSGAAKSQPASRASSVPVKREGSGIISVGSSSAKASSVKKSSSSSSFPSGSGMTTPASSAFYPSGSGMATPALGAKAKLSGNASGRQSGMAQPVSNRSTPPLEVQMQSEATSSKSSSVRSGKANAVRVPRRFKQEG